MRATDEQIDKYVASYTPNSEGWLPNIMVKLPEREDWEITVGDLQCIAQYCHAAYLHISDDLPCRLCDDFCYVTGRTINDVRDIEPFSPLDKVAALTGMPLRGYFHNSWPHDVTDKNWRPVNLDQILS